MRSGANFETNAGLRLLSISFLILGERFVVVLHDVTVRERHVAHAALARSLPDDGTGHRWIKPDVVLDDKFLIVARRSEDRIEIVDCARDRRSDLRRWYL